MTCSCNFEFGKLYKIYSIPGTTRTCDGCGQELQGRVTGQYMGDKEDGAHLFGLAPHSCLGCRGVIVSNTSYCLDSLNVSVIKEEKKTV